MTVIGIHTPETAGEHKVESVRQKVKDNHMEYPVLVDNDHKNWDAWGNRYWPSTYIIDKKGTVRYRWDGELNWKEVKGEAIMRKKIEGFLAEKE